MEFFFEQNQTVDAVDKVPQPFQGFYAKGEGDKFAIRPELADVAKSIDGMNKTNKTLRSGEKAYKDTIAKWSALGETPEAVSAALAELNDKLAKGEKINPDKIREEITKANEAKFKEKDTRIEGLTAAVRKHLITSVATAAVAEAKGSPDLLLPHIERQVKMVEDKGDFKVVVVDAEGETRYGATGQPMTIAELVANMKTDKVFGRAFESEQQGGSGGQGKGTRTAVDQNLGKKPGADMSAVDKIAAGLAKRAAGG